MLHELELGTVEVGPLLHGNRVGIGLAGASGDGDGRGTRFETTDGPPAMVCIVFQHSRVANRKVGDEASLSAMRA